MLFSVCGVACTAVIWRVLMQGAGDVLSVWHNILSSKWCATQTIYHLYPALELSI